MLSVLGWSLAYPKVPHLKHHYQAGRHNRMGLCYGDTEMTNMYRCEHFFKKRYKMPSEFSPNITQISPSPQKIA